MTDQHQPTRAADDLSLSPAGHSRREAMLGTLLADMRGLRAARRRRRRAAILAAPAVLLGVLAAAWWFSARTTTTDSVDPYPQHTIIVSDMGKSPHTPVAPAAQPAAVIQVVTSRDFVSESRIIRTDPTAAANARIDDGELLTTLALIDRPAGLVRADGRAWLTREVVDQPHEPGL